MTCLNCKHWRISAKDRSGAIKILPMAEFKFGSCAKVGEWHYTPPTHQCPKFEQAPLLAVRRREDIFSGNLKKWGIKDAAE